MIITSLNCNGISRAKIQSLLQNLSPSYPTAIIIQEPKSSFPPPIDGYHCIHNLKSEQHGCCIYLKLNVSNFLSHKTNHNNIIISFSYKSRNYILWGFYNPWSTRHDWECECSDSINTVRQIIVSHASPHEFDIVCGCDFNFRPTSIEFHQLCDMMSTINLSPYDTNIKTFKEISTIDYIFSNESDHLFSVLPMIQKCDHKCTMLEVPDLNPAESPIPNLKFNFKNVPLHLIKEKLFTINTTSILNHSANLNDFFIALELEISLRFSEYIRSSSSPSALIKKFTNKDLCKLIPSVLNRPNTLKEVSKLSKPNQAPNNVNIAADTLNIAEFYPVSSKFSYITKKLSSPQGLTFTISEISNCIKSLKISKSTGLSLIDARILKCIPKKWLVTICKIFNTISKHGVPTIFRFKKCLAIPKKGSGIRPICITMLFAKVYEKCLAARLIDFTKSLLPCNQSAYLSKRRGAEEHLFTSKVLSEKYQDLVMLLFDYKQAFSTLPNQSIIYALDCLPIPLELKIALADALKYFIILNPVTGTCHFYFRGVPQGHPCGGIIFILAISKISRNLNSITSSKPVILGNNNRKIILNHVFFADDLKCYVRCHVDESQVIDTVLKCSQELGLPLNLKKSFKIGPNFGSSSLSHVQQADYLGVVISYSNLNGYSFRRTDTTQALVSKISYAVSKIPNVDSLIDIIKSFNSGPYAQHICLSDTILKSNSAIEVHLKTKSKNSHLKKIVGDFCGVTNNFLFSITKITRELDISSSLFGFTLVRYAAGFSLYLESLPNHCPASFAYLENSSIKKSLTKAVEFSKDHICSKRISIPSPWLRSNKCLKRKIAPFILNISTCDRLNSEVLLTLIRSKQYKKAKEFIENHVSTCPHHSS